MALAQFVLFVNENLQQSGRGAMSCGTLRSTALIVVRCVAHLAFGVISVYIGIYFIFTMMLNMGSDPFTPILLHYNMFGLNEMEVSNPSMLTWHADQSSNHRASRSDLLLTPHPPPRARVCEQHVGADG